MIQSFEDQLKELIEENREMGMSVEEITEWMRSVTRELEDEYE